MSVPAASKEWKEYWARSGREVRIRNQIHHEEHLISKLKNKRITGTSPFKLHRLNKRIDNANARLTALRLSL